MNWLMFENEGELDLNGIRLLGASSKRGDDAKIGFFGTGWKYAMAVLLRTGAKIAIFSGEKEATVELSPTSMRGQQFDEILIDGQPTGITTAVGPKWELWMAVRELLCNAIDEGGMVVETFDGVPEPARGKTRVCVSYEHVREVWEKRELYFRLEDSQLEKLPSGRIFAKTEGHPGIRIYRKGILVYTSIEASSYDYEVDVPISEERLADYYEVRRAVWALLQEASLDIKRSLLREMSYFEATCPNTWNTKPHSSWIDALEGRTIATAAQGRMCRGDGVVLPDAWVAALRGLEGVFTVEHRMVAHAVRGAPGGESAVLEAAVSLLQKVGINIGQVVVTSEVDEPKLEGSVILLPQGMGMRDLMAAIVRLAYERDHGYSRESALAKAVVDIVMDGRTK